MRLTRVEIKNWYNIKSANLDLSDGRALVVGPNGCGKTNIIKCIAKLFQSIGSDLSSLTFREKLEDKRPGDSFVDLYFNFNESEREIFLKLRMIAVTSRVFMLYEFLTSKTDSRDSKKFQEKFRNESVPLLLKLLNSSCASLSQWRKQRNSPDVIVSHAKPPNEYSECFDYILNVELPDNTVEETQIISEFFKKEFGEAVLRDKSNKLKRKSTDEEEKLEVREIIRDIVSHDKFTCLECSRDSSEMSDIYKPAILRYSFNLPTLREYSSKSLHETVTNFFKHGTACILPQNRGYSRDELHYQFWNLEKSVASIEEAYLWEQGSKMFDRLNKVKEAMLFIAGLELDVAKYPHDKFRPFQRLDQCCSCKQASIILREFNKPQAEWRHLSELSGGQRELLMILSTIHLSGADTVLLDEPGHSLHPPKQAQLRRWFETKREPNQVLFAITHSPDMISPHWLGALYHMSPDEDGYSTACLKETLRENGDKAADAIESSQTILSTSLVVDSAAGSSSSNNEVNEPPSKRRRTSPESPPQVTIEVGVNMIDFLMGMEMRRLFFSSGVVFVEGDTDRRIIQALRAVKLEKVDIALQDPNLSIRLWNEAHKETQMDRWDIIPISGSANWLKAYAAAENLKIPFITVLDADVFNKKRGSKILPITSEYWEQSRLRNTISKSKYASDHPLKKMVEKVDDFLKKHVKRTGDKEIQVRKEMERCNLWVWNEGDLEDLFFMDERVTEKLAKNEQFMKTMEELQLYSPHQTTSERSEMSALSTLENFKQNCYSVFLAKVQDIQTEFDKTMKKLEDDPQNTDLVTSLSKSSALETFAGQVKQKLQNHVKFVEKGTKLEKQADKGETNVMQHLKAVDLYFWQRVKTNLHDKGNWKRISFKLLKAMVQIAIDEENHQLNKLWECIKSSLISTDVIARLPTFLIEEKVTSMLKTDH